MRGMLLSFFALGFFTFISVFAFLAMLFLVDPAYADSGTLAVFLVSFFVAGSSIITWCILVLRSRFARTKRPMAYFFSPAVRQGALASGVATAALLLQLQGHLSFLTVFAVIIAASIFEGWLSRRSFFMLNQ